MKKKKFIVLPRNGTIFEKGLTTSRGHRKFKKPGAMWITDESEAREIEHEYGMKGKRQVAVTTDQQYEWSANNEGGDGRRMDNIHNYTFAGVDTSRIRRTRDNGYVWVQLQGKQVRMKRREAEGLEIAPQKRNKRRKGAEVTDDTDIIEGNAKSMAGTRPRPGHRSHRRQSNNDC
jgi:hypothetical protein